MMPVKPRVKTRRIIVPIGNRLLMFKLVHCGHTFSTMSGNCCFIACFGSPVCTDSSTFCALFAFSSVTWSSTPPKAFESVQFTDT